MRPPSSAAAASPAPLRIAPSRPRLREEFIHATDLRRFVDGHRDRLADPETAFYVAEALEECALARATHRDERFSGEERRAAQELAGHCRGFGDARIDSPAIGELLRYAARWGEPHALARMLLLRDVAAPKDDVLGELPWMLSSRDPSIVRDVGAFMSRGDAEWPYGGERVPTAVAALAWELAACDLDDACKPWSRFGLAQCALLGRCGAGRYEDAVALFEPPELMAQASALRYGILRALREKDWRWLGLA